MAISWMLCIGLGMTMTVIGLICVLLKKQREMIDLEESEGSMKRRYDEKVKAWADAVTDLEKEKSNCVALRQQGERNKQVVAALQKDIEAAKKSRRVAIADRDAAVQKLDEQGLELTRVCKKLGDYKKKADEYSDRLGGSRSALTRNEKKVRTLEADNRRLVKALDEARGELDGLKKILKRDNRAKKGVIKTQ